MKKILYLLHIDWNWIKQRPQFIAEELSCYYSVVCTYPHWYNRSKLQTTKKKSNIKFYQFYGLPKGKKYHLIRKINNKLRSISDRLVLKISRCDLVYVTTPEMYSKWISRCGKKVIYDCMDDHVSLTKDEKTKKLIAKNESLLSERADIVLVSSKTLEDNLINKYGIDKEKIHIVRNGYSGKVIEILSDSDIKTDCFHIGYIGTVSSWFDIKNIMELLNKHNDIILHIIGPIQPDIKIPGHPQIIIEGIVEHNNLYNKICGYDALIMPFVVNDIVKAVDPVKLYEYINFNKPIISVYYDEIERFDSYVWFYGEGHGTLDEAVKKAHENGCKYSNSERVKMLEESSWRERVAQIKRIIETL